MLIGVYAISELYFENYKKYMIHTCIHAYMPK